MSTQMLPASLLMTWYISYMTMGRLSPIDQQYLLTLHISWSSPLVATGM